MQPVLTNTPNHDALDIAESDQKVHALAICVATKALRNLASTTLLTIEGPGNVCFMFCKFGDLLRAGCMQNDGSQMLESMFDHQDFAWSLMTKPQTHQVLNMFDL